VKQNHRMLLLWASAACLMVMTLFASSTAWAQQAAGSITGLVTDPSGSAVANATVTARDVDRGTTWTTKTTDAGLYEFPQISVGNIQLKVDAAGFSAQVHNAFTLVLNQVARVDFHMKVGGKAETITVTTAPPLLQTSSTELGTLIDADAAVSLPLATRDLNQLTLLAPGVLTSNIFAFEGPQTTFGTGRPYINGAREQDDNFILDGMDINQPDNDEVSYVPNPDAVQEFNVIYSNAPADYGNYGGGVIVESTKSGTNQFHGDLFEYVRNTEFEANTWQDKALPAIQGFQPYTVAPRPVLQWNEFGGTVGGPIIKNKLFFFVDEQTSLYNQPKSAVQNTLVPDSNFYTSTTADGITGYNLGAYYCTGAGGTFNSAGICTGGTGTQLYMPVSGTAPGARTAIPYDIIPASAADPAAAKLVALPAYQEQVTTLNYFQSGYTHDFQGDVKIDWQPTDNDHIMARYSQMDTKVIQSNGTDVLTPNLERTYPLKNIVLDYVRTITPTLVNDFRVGTSIFPANDEIFSSATSGNLNTTIGLPGVATSFLPSIATGFGSVGGSGGFEVFHDTTNEIEDSLSWTHGKHNVHTGFQFLHYDMNDVYASNNGAAGSWSFTGEYTNNSGASNGSAYADFLLGLPASVGVGVPIHFNLANSLVGGFVQDNYQPSHSLTLNLGVRYEVNTPRGDRDKNKNINFDKLTGNPEVGVNYDAYYGIGDIQPRVGFSWQPDWAPGTVLRGAYDISSFMEGNGIGNMAVINPPNSISVSVTNNALTAPYYPQYTLSNGYTPYESPCTISGLLALSPACIAGETTHSTDPHLRPAMNQQWNLTLQHQFRNNFTASIGYVGDKDDHMADINDFNQGVMTANNTAVQGPYQTNLVNAGAHLARWNESAGISRYEALELTLAQKSYHGLDMQANYTMSKCLDNSLGYFGAYGDEEGIGEQQNEGGGNFFQNSYNQKGDYGRCSIDAKSAFNAYALYNLPFGRGKQFFSNVPKAADEVIGGWNISADTTFRSGFAVTPYGGSYMGSVNPLSASSLTGSIPNGFSYVPRADCVAGQAPGQKMAFTQIGSSIGMTNLNPAAVAPQADYQFGNCGVGYLRGPSLKTADMNINKKFPIAGSVNMVFMAQFMNLTNTPIFSIPNSWWDSYSSCVYCTGVRTTGATGGQGGSVGAYGLLDGTNPGRQIEFSLKLNF